MTDKDYKVVIKIKNNIFLKTMERNGFYSLTDLSKASGVAYGTISNIANLKLPVFMSFRGKKVIRKPYQELMTFFGCTMWELAPEQHFDEILPSNTATMDLDLKEVESLMIGHDVCQDPQKLLERKEMSNALNEQIDTLDARSADILRSRLGLDGEPQTFDAISKKYKISRDRVMQIEKRSMVKLSHPSKKAKLRIFTRND